MLLYSHETSREGIPIPTAHLQSLPALLADKGHEGTHLMPRLPLAILEQSQSDGGE